VIRERLEKRGTETRQSIEERVAKAAYEMQFKDQFKHIIINDDLEKATQDLIAVVQAHL
jgi:guanylate kinase